MQSCGVKRPLSDREDEEIQEDSPEYLLPVKDPYSSDDDKMTTDIKKTCNKIKQMKDLKTTEFLLPETEFCCNITPELATFLLNVDFKPMQYGEITPKNETVDNSVEDCLFKIYQFISNIDSPLKQEDFKFNNKSMTEVKALYIEKLPSVKWLYKHDTYDWKDIFSGKLEILKEITLKRELLKEKFYSRPSPDLNARLDRECCKIILSSLDIYEAVITRSEVYDHNKRGIKSQILLTFFTKLGILEDSDNFINTGLCRRGFNVNIPEDWSQVKSRCCRIVTQPDGVFKSVLPDVWKIVLKIYDATNEEDHDGSLSPSHPELNSPGLSGSKSSHCDIRASTVDRSTYLHPECLHIKKNKMDHSLLKNEINYFRPQNKTYGPQYEIHSFGPQNEINFSGPKNKIDLFEPQNDRDRFSLLNVISTDINETDKTPGVIDARCISERRQIVKQAIPGSCHNPCCVDQMTGQHVIQLLSQALENHKLQLKSRDKMSKPGDNIFDLEDNIGDNMFSSWKTLFQREIGMFVVNEHVYFSRLDIQPGLLPFITGEQFQETNISDVNSLGTKYREHFKAPCVSYSHFRLDITKASHRLALLIFIKERTLSL